MFIFIVVAGVLANFEIQNNPSLTQILSYIGSIFFLLWPLLLGHELYQFVPKSITLKYNLFIINGFLWILAYTVLLFVFNGYYESNNGLIVLAGFYLLYALFQFAFFPVKTLKTIEIGKIASISEYFMDFMLFVFSPIGIWFLQPRINKIAERSQDVDINSSAPIDRPPYNA